MRTSSEFRTAQANPSAGQGKRVLLNAPLHGAGGRETHLLNLCQVLRDQGAEVTVVSRLANPETPLLRRRGEMGVRFVGTPFPDEQRWFLFSSAWATALWPLLLRAESFDVLYSMEVTRFVRFLSRFVKQEGWVIAGRAGDLLRPHERPEEKVLQCLDAYVVETALQSRAVRQVCGEKMLVASIPLLGHLGAIAPRGRISHDELQVRYLGRYDRAKGVFRLLDIWQQLELGCAHLSFHGHGPEEQQLRKEVANRGLQGFVSVHGGYSTADELASIMAETDLLVLLSETEGLPVVLLEAMAYGVPFVATDVGAVRSLAEENPDVRVVPGTEQAIVGAIREMEAGIRSGAVSGTRLQRYHSERYGRELVAGKWIQALLSPETFWSEAGESEGLPQQLAPVAAVR
ncbi:MAG: glycosyltransferase [Candidatus Korobacteraceae bacterium]